MRIIDSNVKQNLINPKIENATNVIPQNMLFENINNYEEPKVSSVTTPVPIHKSISSKQNKGKTID